MLLTSIGAVSAGAALGALLRWFFSAQLNALFPHLPPGTLLANLLGGYLIGVAASLFAQYPSLSPEARLFMITGFLGGLTTFSTFSAEVVALLRDEQFMWALGAICVHVLGSLGMTLLGIATVAMVRLIR